MLAGMGMRISAGEWAELVTAWAASGQSAGKFAAEHGLLTSREPGIFAS